MIFKITLITAGCFLFLLNSCAQKPAGVYEDQFIRYEPVKLTEDEKRILGESLEKRHERYDPAEKMLTRTLSGWNYHTDAESGVFHEVRGSFNYAVGLLDMGDENYAERAFDIIDATIALQDTDSLSRTCGVWPYYKEEPLATKKSPVDFNWADFNGVSLLEVFMGHNERLPAALKAKIRRSLILAARSIQKRDVQPGYTNIAIMGTYVTYMTSHLFDLPEMKEYANDRLRKFYDFTLSKGGFKEYNSPTYTIVALDELYRMKEHIVDPEATSMIDSLYSTGWKMIARHYHKPSGQWAGPHSRSYSSLVRPSFYGILKQASKGKIDLGFDSQRSDVKIKHNIPEYLLSYFVSPEYPRTEKDVFTPDDPEVAGTAYLTDSYAVATANRSSMWNQRRPFLAYWGTVQQPYYLQVRFLHDLYDFSCARFFSRQKENNVLAAINFSDNGGDKHINIDRLKDGKFKASDLRLRFEFGNYTKPADLNIPEGENDRFNFVLDGVQFDIQLYRSVFGDYNGHWEKGGDSTASWIDYVIYSGQEREIDLNGIDEAVLGFTFGIGADGEELPDEQPVVSVNDNSMDVKWEEFNLDIPVKPSPQPGNL